MSVARAYAKALFEAAKEAGASAAVLSQTEQELSTIFDAVESSKELRGVLFAPITTAKEKLAVLDALVQKSGASKLTSEFMRLLANKGRLSLIGEIRNAYSTVRLHSEGGVAGNVVSAEPLNPEDVDSLASAFSKKLGKKVSFTVSTDADLLAGMKVTVSGVTYDGSLRSQLQQLRDRVLSSHADRTELKTNH
jgi:F-type H+-transporting ATPase subunit delta